MTEEEKQDVVDRLNLAMQEVYSTRMHTEHDQLPKGVPAKIRAAESALVAALNLLHEAGWKRS